MAKKSGYVSDLSATDNYGLGFSLSLANFLPFLGVVLLAILIEFFGSSGNLPGSGIYFDALAPFVLGILIVGPIRMSTAWLFLKAARNQKFEIWDMFAVFSRNYWNAVLASLISAVLVLLGFVFFIIPGIIIAIRLTFVRYLIIDEKMDAVDAIKKSWTMTKGHSWTIFWMLLIAMFVLLLGVICLGVGVLFSIMWTASSFAILYNTVSSKTKVQTKTKTVKRKTTKRKTTKRKIVKKKN